MITHVEVEIDLVEIIPYVQLLDAQWPASFDLIFDVEGPDWMNADTFRENFGVFAARVSQLCFEKGAEFEIFYKRFCDYIRIMFLDFEEWRESVCI